MKILKFAVLLFLTSLLIFFLNQGHKIGEISIPPLGHFLDPFKGFMQNADKDRLSIKEEISSKDLKESVTISYDKNEVPHIFAQNNDDLYFAQGYIMAQNRLWQMEFQVMAAAGRLSEILGKNERIQYFDRLQRRKGMVYGAERSVKRMKEDPEIVAYAAAFANGVNYYINSLSYKTLPIEYKLLDYKPETWTFLKNALILEYMIDNLTGSDNDLENTNALALLGRDTFNLLFPERMEGLDPTVPTDRPWSFTPLPFPQGENNYELLRTFSPVTKTDPDNGSNNWAVSPEKSATGNALLANDPHLGLNLPSLWMMLHLQSPEYNVYGFTFPGALGITIGFNDSISWGFTNAPRDTRDWFRIEFQDESRESYRFDSGWKKTQKIVEEIKIKGHPSIYDTVAYTHHGPIVYDEKFRGPNSYLALKWGGHEGSMAQKTLLLLNKAKNFREYQHALLFWDQPPQNAVFASVQGDIALSIAGNFPLKWEGQGKFILEGSIREHDWNGSIPKEHNPFHLNPERGFVSSANQHSVDEQYPYWFYSSTNEYYRNRRINRLLSNSESISIKNMMDFQNDNYSIKAEEILPIFLVYIDKKNFTSAELEIINNLQKWDYVYEASSQTPIYFNVWWQNFYEMLWDEFDRKEILEKPDDFVTINHIKNRSIDDFLDIQETPEEENLQHLIGLSFKKALQVIEERRESADQELNWGNYKNTSVIHLARLKPFSHNVSVSGHADALNSTKSNHGPSFRMVVEMSKPPKAWAIYPGGQSGNPGSPAYDNMLEEWRDGAYRELFFPTSVDEANLHSLKIQTLKPLQK